MSPFLRTVCSPHSDDPNSVVALGPDDSDEAPVQFSNGDPPFFCVPGRRDRINSATIEQQPAADEIQTACFENRKTLGLRPLKLHRLTDVATPVAIINYAGVIGPARPPPCASR